MRGWRVRHPSLFEGRRVDPARRACPTSARAYGDREINPLSRASRRAEALGYPGRSPPARAIPDYLFKDHQPAAGV